MTTLIRGNALALPLADNSVDLIVTSPPYFGLRSYTDAGEHYDGQIGSEATPGEFLDALIAATAEMVRVLKPSGSIFVNLGDKYANDSKWGGSTGGKHVPGLRGSAGPGRGKRSTGMPAKSLMGLPWRYAIRCIGNGTALNDPDVVRLLLRDVALEVISLAEAERIVDDLHATPDPGLGLILRSEIIWSKPNGLPESVTDRVRRSHEQWFHFTKQPRYFAAVDHIREQHAPGTHQRRIDGQPTPKQAAGVENGTRRGYMAETYTNPLGKLPGSVWSVPTQPLTVPADLGVDHFAAFPMEWPRRIIRGWSPTGICTVCGEGRRPVASIQRIHGTARRAGSAAGRGGPDDNHRGMNAPGDTRPTSLATITGYACACPEPTAPTRPAVVLDPFGGTGTTAIVANALGRHGISVDMSADYLRLARWRANDPRERAKAAGVDAPPPAPTDMDGLW